MTFEAKWYTRASRVRIVIAKFDGRWTLPGGPYPIPELVAAVGGILATLFALPRLGHPIQTAVVGAVATVLLVTVMRRMPYSPVKFSTRIHRAARLYTSPVTLTGAGVDSAPKSAVSIARQAVTILDPDPLVAAAPARRRDPAGEQWGGIFAPTHVPAADLFR